MESIFNMKVYFLNSQNKYREIGQFNNKTELFNIIESFLTLHDFKSYYTRIWYEPNENRTYYDVGSHTEFFFTDCNTMRLE
jgi:hypothetical protein